MTNIFSSLTLPNGAVIPNRIAKAATQENLADEDQNPSSELIQLYKTWSEGGAGLSISGHIMIDRRACGGPGDVVLEDDSNLQIFEEWAKAGSVGGNQFWLQINHPGRQLFSNLGQPALAPSAIKASGPNASLFAAPQEITEAQIQEVIERFLVTSQLAERAGFTGVQVHAAHGYLISQFLSPLSNQRTDKWGGSLENRSRLLFEVIKKIRSGVSPKFCVAVKINSADFQRGGFGSKDAKWVVQQLNDMDVDLIELSGGNYESPAMFGEQEKPDEKSNGEVKTERTLAREAYFLTFAEEIAKVANIPVMVTGGISRRQILDSVMESGVAMAGIATALILKPDLPNVLKEGQDPHPQLPAITWSNTTLKLLARLSYINYQLVAIGRTQKVSLDVWPSRTVLKQIWFTVFRSRKYRQRMQSYVYKGPVKSSA
ncbi:hypothetical protein Unana1_07380 [Umbelopsis nana]